jgi:hypothetical protein
MYGLLFLIIGTIYLAVVIALLFWVKQKWGKALVLIAAILIPNVDDWYYQHELAQYCKNEAGFKVYQQLSRREGVVLLDGSGEFIFKRTAIAYAEWPETKPNGKGVMVTRYWRSDRLPDGGASNPYQIGNYTAPYEFSRFEKDSGTFVELMYTIKRRADSQLVAEFKTLFYYGSWYPTVVIGRTSLDAGCRKDGKTLSGRQWKQKDSGALDGAQEIEFINKTFTTN